MAGRRCHRANGGGCGAVGPSPLEDNDGRPTVCWTVDRSDSEGMNSRVAVGSGDAARGAFAAGVAVASAILQSGRAVRASGQRGTGPWFAAILPEFWGSRVPL